MENKLLTTKEVAWMLGYSPRYFNEKFRLRTDTGFPEPVTVQWSKRRRWLESEVIKWARNNTFTGERMNRDYWNQKRLQWQRRFGPTKEAA